MAGGRSFANAEELLGVVFDVLEQITKVILHAVFPGWMELSKIYAHTNREDAK
jgi:hypothetical protein